MVWRAYPSATAGPAAAAGLRAPPTASGAPATPCQRRDAAAPRAAAAAAAPPRRAITRPDPRDTDPRLPSRTPAYSDLSNTIGLKFNSFTDFIYRTFFTTARRRPRVPSDPRASPVVPRVCSSSHGVFLSIVVQRSAAIRGAAEPPVCGLAEAPRARSRAAAHSSAARRRAPPYRRCPAAARSLADLAVSLAASRPCTRSSLSRRSRHDPHPHTTAYYYANYLVLFKICLFLTFHLCLMRCLWH